ncbi:MAG: hypothetical protein U1A77_13775 [Pirellulales bacterium]
MSNETMTTVAPRLAPLRRQLAALHRARHSTRQVAAWSVVALAVVGALASLWALDVRFELSVAQRLVMLALAAGAVAWVYRKFAAELLAKRESIFEVALLVERRHRIDTDLVAALQFESPEANQWGSSQLEAAVIDQVAVSGERLEVFDGFSREQATRRASWFLLALLVLGGTAFFFPGHARVFWNRLWLGSMHYPTRTVIERIAINDQLVLDVATRATSPRRSAAAQGRALLFLVRATGERPADGLVRIGSLRGGATRPIELSELTLEERRSRVEAAVKALEEVAAEGSSSSGPTVDDATLLPYLDCESAEVASLWRQARDATTTWAEVSKATQALLTDWDARAETATVYRGELGRLVESIEYKVFLGDAWTDPAEVAMTPRPLVEPRLKATAPSYAKGAETVREMGPGRLTVLEGSTVDVALECTNGKRLKEAWLTWLATTGPRRFNLKATDESQTSWKLVAAESPFREVREDLRFELQVRDEDGLTLETPLAGIVRVQPDRSPSAAIQLVHRVVLPAAKPVLQYRILDDYGISRIELHMRVTRRQNGTLAETGVPRSEVSEGAALDDSSVLLSQPAKIVRASELPLNGNKAVELAPLKLEKGDQLTLVLEVTDYRGEGQGSSFRSEPVTLEISDEAGVLSAVLEADQKAEERLTEIIKRQLGIGETP